jgi:hypothetical protein
MQSTRARSARSALLSLIETLENRRFHSATTVDDFKPALGQPAHYNDMTSDAAGNVYAAGAALDAAGALHGIVRKLASGDTTWQTILDQPLDSSQGQEFSQITVAPSGDIYLAVTPNGTSVYKLAVGQTTAQAIPGIPNVYNTINDLTVDAAGNVFTVGQEEKLITVVNKKGQTSSYLEDHWIVRELAAGTTSFTIVDDCFSPSSYRYPAATSIAATPSGLYVTGRVEFGAYPADDRWIVRKSTDSGHTWTTVDSFQYSTATATSYGSQALGVTSDSAGNIYVAGHALLHFVTGGSKGRPTYGFSHHWLVRKSTDGGASWSNDAVIQTADWVYWCSMGVDSSNNVYVVDTETINNDDHQVVRSNASGSWQVIDDFNLAAGHSTLGYGLATDASGNVYVADTAYDSADAPHAIVRQLLAAPAATFSSPSISVTEGSIVDELVGTSF